LLISLLPDFNVREALEDFTKHYLLSREVAASGEPFQHATIYWDQAQA
jgi:hypothetical protein